MAYRATVLAEGLWAIDEQWVQSFLVEGSEYAALIDAGCTCDEEFAHLVRGLTDKAIMLVLTHSDGDHTGNLADFAPAFAHPSEFARLAARGFVPKQLRGLWEGSRLDLGGTSLEVVLAPGHTPGSIALLDRAHGRLFVGDSISDAWVYLFGEGRSLPAYLESLRRFERLAGLAGAASGSAIQGTVDEGVGACASVGEGAGAGWGVVEKVEPCSLVSVHGAHGSFSLPPEWIARTRRAAEFLLAGELEGVTPRDTPDGNPLPCLCYSHEGVNLLYQES